MVILERNGTVVCQTRVRSALLQWLLRHTWWLGDTPHLIRRT